MQPHASSRIEASSARKIAARLALAGACTAGLAGAGAGPASAGSHERILTKGGVVWFDHTGDYIGALDRRKDGYAVRAYLNWMDPRTGDLKEASITDTRGYRPGSPDPHRAVYRSLSSIPEGTEVTLTLCYAQGEVNRRCSQSQKARA
jgi:hypothetical protein